MVMVTVTRWLPKANFVTLHYAYIIFMSILSLVVLYPFGNLDAVDAYFFGASASTESGLNTVDVKELKTYQQLYIYFIPIFTNLGFINAVVVLVRFLWFRKHLRTVAPKLLSSRRRRLLAENGAADVEEVDDTHDRRDTITKDRELFNETETTGEASQDGRLVTQERGGTDGALSAANLQDDAALYIPGPRDRDNGQPIVQVKSGQGEKDGITFEKDVEMKKSGLRRRYAGTLSESTTAERVANITSSLFVMGNEPTKRNTTRKSQDTQRRPADPEGLLALSRQATLGRNSDFLNLTKEDREKLGGIEYRSLKLLLKIVFSYFFGLHIFGAICLVGWIQYADPKYKTYLQECGQNMNWWAFYSAQTMVDNLGFTLTPDSMITFRDALWPMFIMSFLAFAGNTLYPVLLRLVIWTTYKLTPKNSSIREPLSFLLNHPRRCYTLLFPSRPTWILFSIIFALNFIDVLLILVLDLKNPEVASMSLGPRILAAIFQAASSRHTGTSTFNLANVNPAVQFSLMIMMYIAIFPIALSIRTSNIYEEKSLGIYDHEKNLDEKNGGAYITTHFRNQLAFDLWYIFLGIFCICISESKKIVDLNEPAFSVWSVFFEVTSAYGNVGLSLGHPSVATSLSGQFNIFSKLVVCAVMIRGRHRGLPYAVDRAIMLPDEHATEESSTDADK